MKKLFVLFSLSLFMCYSQENANKNEALYLYFPAKNFYGNLGDYNTFFTIKSQDTAFHNDSYNFKIYDKTGHQKSLYSLGIRKENDSTKFIIPAKHYSNQPPCEVHKRLSLFNETKSIYIVTKIPPDLLIREADKSKKYMVWPAIYNGTNKNFNFTKINRGPFYTRQ